MTGRIRPRVHIERLEDRSLPSFVAAHSFIVGPKGGSNSKPQAIISADFNRDGLLDVATANKGGVFANSGNEGVSILLGTGKGSFKPAKNIYTTHSAYGIIAVDLNADGKLDLVTADKDDNAVTVLLGNGAGGFTIAGTFDAGKGPNTVAAGDFNGDGYVDLAVADSGASEISILLGNGKGKFTQGTVLPVNTHPTSVVVADFNNDHHPDIASVSDGFGHLDINLNTGTGTFAAAVNYATGFVSYDLVVGYFNNDAQPDLAVACTFPSNNGVSILLGNPDGTFQLSTNFDTGGQTPHGIAIGDFNGDGKQDLITANGQFANNSVTMLLGNGNGMFGPASVLTSGQEPMDVAVGDFNRDGRLDAVTADTGTPPGKLLGPAGTVTMLFGNGDGTLVASQDLTVSQPGAIIATDLTGDSILDLAVVTKSVPFNGVTIFPGLGNGAFGPRILTSVINAPTGIAFGLFDADGYRDLVVSSDNGVTVLLNNGDGTYTTRHDYAVTGKPVWVAVDDFNGDQMADLVVADSNGVDILLGNGDGTFGSPTAFAAGGAATYVTTSDFNRDGKRDLAVVNGSANTVSTVFGQGDGTFTLSAPPYATPVGPSSVSAGDFNGDGKPDLAIPTFFGDTTGNTLAILVNGTNGKFAKKTSYLTDSRPIGSLVVDWNGDHKADLAVVNDFSDDLFVFGGSGTGAFGKPTRYIVGDRPTWLASADFNGDGKPDLAVVNSNSSTVTLLETPTPTTQFHAEVLASTVTAGKTVQVVVSPADAAGRLLPDYTGLVTLTSTDPHAKLASHKFTAADHGNYVFTVTLRTAGTQSIVAHGSTATGAGSVQVIATAATHLSVAASTTAVAGTPFDLTVAALDRFGNPDPAFAGTIHLVATDKATGASLPVDYTFVAGDAGTHTFSGGVTLLTVGKRTISASTVGAKIAGKLGLTVVAGALSKFVISGLPLSFAANSLHSFTVIAQDAYGNTITNYAGTVEFDNIGGTAILPATYTFLPTNKGKHVFKVVFQTPGPDQSLTVMDQADNGITGSITGITVL